jgi:predicted lactoylglutathione lyase
MTKELWVNLPVKDVNKSKEFFGKIGFALDEKHGGDDMACLIVGKNDLKVLLFAETTFKNFTKNEIPVGGQTTEVLFSIEVESREEVDETAKKVWDAGGKIFSEPEEIQGWMYGCAFADLDGHRWNVMEMDFSKMPQQ